MLGAFKDAFADLVGALLDDKVLTGRQRAVTDDYRDDHRQKSD